VNLRGGSAVRLASAKAWLHRGTFALLFGAAFALMILGKADTPLIERARVSVVDALSPIMEGLAKPIASVRQLYDNARDFWSLREQNANLKADQDRLLEWQTVARQLQAENDALRAMLKLVPEPGATFVTARVVADNGGAFVRTVLPLAIPGLAASAIFVIIISWNEVFAASTLTLRNPTLPAQVVAAIDLSPRPFKFAAGLALTLPAFAFVLIMRPVLFSTFQRRVR